MTLPDKKVLSVRDLAPPPTTAQQAYLLRETWRRRQLAAVTYAIEVRGIPLMLESDWDCMAQSLYPGLGTCDPVLDEFWRTKFSPMTTAWIYDYPAMDDVARAFDHYQAIMRGTFDFTDPKNARRLKKKTKSTEG